VLERPAAQVVAGLRTVMAADTAARITSRNHHLPLAR